MSNQQSIGEPSFAVKNSRDKPACTVCEAESLIPALSFGSQPPSNRFFANSLDASRSSERYPLSLGMCTECGTIQLVDRMPLEEVRPRHDWLVYNEPEGHLDDLADRLSRLEGIDLSSRFLGVTYKDKSTLDRMTSMGYVNAVHIDERRLECPYRVFGLETIQDIYSQPDAAIRIGKIYGTADVLLMRHVVEHATNSTRLIHALRTLLAPGGYMVLELPDSERILKAGNYPFIWEEHISYFTGPLTETLAERVGAEVVWFGRYPYAFEDSLVLILRFAENGPPVVPAASTEKCIASERMLDAFGGRFDSERVRWRRQLAEFRSREDKVAIFGAGHLAAKFINFFSVADLIDCVIDDHPHKVGLFMPGSGLPIVASSELATRAIRVCISTLSPESDAKVRMKLASYFEAGGRFIPAFTIV